MDRRSFYDLCVIVKFTYILHVQFFYVSFSQEIGLLRFQCSYNIKCFCVFEKKLKYLRHCDVYDVWVFANLKFVLKKKLVMKLSLKNI